ncbi:MAG: hypothetical protein AAF630_10120 [Cyanobacteria bacterium P01_C01_bin.38]
MSGGHTSCSLDASEQDAYPPDTRNTYVTLCPNGHAPLTLAAARDPGTLTHYHLFFPQE